jgi:hypothetical protein
MSKNRSEFAGTIITVRAVEDSIRATQKYTEGIGTMRKKHPIQGENFPSRMFVKYYEVYPDVELSWDMPAGVALDWLWGETPCIDVLFNYDYRANKATVIVQNGFRAVQDLERSIPDFKESLAKVSANGDSA